MDANQNPNENPHGSSAPITPNPAPASETTSGAPATVPAAQNTAPTNAAPVPAAGASSFELSETTIMAALSYFGPLVLIPFLVKKDNTFVLFHIKQGIVLLVPYIVLWVLGGFVYLLAPLIMVAQLGLLVFSIIGIINAVQKKEKELPYIGQYAASVKI